MYIYIYRYIDIYIYIYIYIYIHVSIYQICVGYFCHFVDSGLLGDVFGKVSHANVAFEIQVLKPYMLEFTYRFPKIFHESAYKFAYLRGGNSLFTTPCCPKLGQIARTKQNKTKQIKTKQNKVKLVRIM